MASRKEKEQRKETEASDLSYVKEAVVGKTNDEHGTRNEDVGYCDGDVEETTESAARTLDEKARKMKEKARERITEMKENAKDAANETKGYAAVKVREAANRTKQMSEFTKGKTKGTANSAIEKVKDKAQEAAEKTLETSQLAAEKTKDTAQSAAGKLGVLKDKAMGLFSGKKYETKELMYETSGTSRENPREVQQEARRREEEMGLTDRDKYEGDLAGRVLGGKDKRKEDRGGRILGTGCTEGEADTSQSNGDKTRWSTDASRVEARNEGKEKAQRTSEEKVAEVYKGDTSPGAIASVLKASDQMTRQTFNEVGQINDEGVVRIVRRDLQGKM